MESIALCCDKLVVIFTLPSNSINKQILTLHATGFGCPRPSTDIKLRNLRTKWTGVRSVLIPEDCRLQTETCSMLL